MQTEICFVIIKPHAVHRALVGRILARFEDAGFGIGNLQQRYKTLSWARQHYEHLKEGPGDAVQELTGEAIYRRACVSISEGPVVGFTVIGPNAVAKTHRLAGGTDPSTQPPGTIRGDFGITLPYNVIHVSDRHSVEREMELFYDPETEREGS